jgi:hypothetical protein
MALGDSRRLRRIEAFVTPLLEPDERIKVAIPQSQTGPSPKVTFVFGLFGLLGASVATVVFRLKSYALVVTERRLLIIRKSNWTSRLRHLEAAITLDQPIGAEFDDYGQYRELQLSRLRGFDSGYMSVWVPKCYADVLAQFRTLVRSPT